MPRGFDVLCGGNNYPESRVQSYEGILHLSLVGCVCSRSRKPRDPSSLKRADSSVHFLVVVVMSWEGRDRATGHQLPRLRQSDRDRERDGGRKTMTEKLNIVQPAQHSRNDTRKGIFPRASSGPVCGLGSSPKHACSS